MLVPPLLVPLTYLVTISPYLYNSKKIYGHAFYNVNSTFYKTQPQLLSLPRCEHQLSRPGTLECA